MAEIDGSDVVAALAELEADDLVTRATDPDDKRRRIVSITAAGKRRLRKLDESSPRFKRNSLAPLSAGERKELVRLLGRLAQR